MNAYQMFINDRLIEMDYHDEPRLTNVSTDWGGRLNPAIGFAGYPVGYVPNQLVGGGRMRDTIVPGAQAAGYPSVAMLAAEPQTGASYPAMELTLESALPSQLMSGDGHFKKMRVKKVKKVVDKVAKEVADQAEIERMNAAEPAPDMVGEGVRSGKISRRKKATKWTSYAADTANKGLDLAKKAAPLVAMLGLGEGAGTLQDVGRFIAPVAKAARKKAIEKIEGMGRPPSARAAVVKAIMAKHGLGMIEASKFVKANGIPY